MRAKTRWLSFVVALAMAFGLAVPAGAAQTDSVGKALADTAAYVQRLVTSPQVGSIGGEWAVLGLARSGCSVPEQYYQDYYATAEEYVRACKGVLHQKKYTEYSRVVVALTAIGKDPRNVGGYNLLTPLGDYEKTIWQGLNGPIWALIALDTANYEMPVNKEAKTQATRQMYLDRILACRLADGGWSLFGGTEAASEGDGISDPDITGMALQALAKYQDQPAVLKAITEALACMSKRQAPNGGFASWGTVNSESCVQMIVALTELGLPLDDARFVKNGKTMVDSLLSFYRKGAGFVHTADSSGSSQMATEQALYGLAAVQRAYSEKISLYRMSDALKIGESTGGLKRGEGLAGKHADIKGRPVCTLGKTFPDIIGTYAHPNQSAIESLAARAIISGKPNGNFEPDGSMTRAEFATIVVNALGLEPKANDRFSDVKSANWFAPYVGTATTYGIVNGVSATRFHPGGTITRQEAAAMVARAAKLCGMNTDYGTAAARDVLAQFSDYVTCASWAQSSLAFCYGQGILDDSVMKIEPRKVVRRCEIAQMIYQLLALANLL